MKTTIKKIVNTRIFWIIISLLFSIILWCYVTMEQGAKIERTFGNVDVVFSGESALQEKELLITDIDNETVSLTLYGNRRVISQLSASDIYVSVDASGITETGKTSLTYSIEYPSSIDTSAIKIVKYSSEFITFDVEKLVTKNITVKGVFEGSVAENRKAEPLEFDPASITVSGPVSEVSQIACAWVVVQQENAARTLTFDSNYTFMDEDDKPLRLHYTDADALAISVKLPIVEVKEVPLAMNIIQGGGATEKDAVITINPATVKLSGDSAILEDINKIVLGTVDLGDITDTFEQTYPIVVDDQLKNLDGISEANVKIEIKGLATKVVTVTKFDCINVMDGYTATISTEALKVVLRGPQDVLDTIDAEDVTAVADLSDLNNATGAFEKSVEISIDGVTEVGAAGDYKVNLSVSKQ
ncbi:MAG: YbbR-like domain-containing protein [Oscillospiraceae bacterium]|jgi:YbbR domain-containing protein